MPAQGHEGDASCSMQGCMLECTVAECSMRGVIGRKRVEGVGIRGREAIGTWRRVFVSFYLVELKL